MPSESDCQELMSRFYRTVGMFVEEHPELIAELQAAERLFADIHIDEHIRRKLLLDWFIFDAVSAMLSANLIDHLVQAGSFEAEDVPAIQRFREGIYGVFSVKAVRMGRQMIVCDLITRREYQVTDGTVTRDVIKGDCLLLRVLPFADFHILSDAAYVFPADVGPVVALCLRDYQPEFGEEKMSLLAVWRLFYEQQTAERLPPAERLLLIGMEGGMSEPQVHEYIARLKDRVDGTGGFTDILEELFARINPPEDFSEEELLETFREVWNGMIAEQDPSAVKGPVENMLIAAGLARAREQVRPEVFPDLKAADEEGNRVIENWLRSPQEELGGRTPKDVILEERRRLGNPQQEFGYRFSISAVQPGRDREIQLERLFFRAADEMQEGRFEEALDIFREYCRMYPRNHVVWHNMAACHYNRGDRKEARVCLLKALEIDPDYKMAREKLVLLDAEE